MPKAHVTGGSGFLGQHLIHELQAHGYVVSMSGSEDALKPESILIPGTDVVIHAGAHVGRERCAEDPVRAITMNVSSTLLLAKFCADSATSFLLVSSAEVNAGKRNLYALTKNWSEDVCCFALPTELLMIARLGMQYGPGARLGRDTLSNFIWSAMRGEDLTVYRDVRRSLTYIGDSARAIRFIAEESARWRTNGKHVIKPAIFDVDSGDARLLTDVARCVVDVVGGPSRIVEVAPPSAYSDLPPANTTTVRTLGWEPETSLADGVQATYDWMRSLEESEMRHAV
jgi:nucleoside-diphosphate-sugar epimerase